VASQDAADLKILSKAILIELPTAAAKRALSVGKENQLEEAAWEAYDAGIRIVRVATGQLYSSPLFGDVIERTLGPMLRVQKLTNSLSGALFSTVWSVVGLPTSAEIHRLRADLVSLRRELRALVGPAASEPGEAAAADIEKRVMRKKKRAAA
jgi:hypothetical protein